MKKSLLLLAIITLTVNGYSQLFTFTFGSTDQPTCTTSSNSATAANLDISPFSRSSTLTCEYGSVSFNSSNWTLSTTAVSEPTDVSGLKFIEVTITPQSGYQLSLSAVNFGQYRSTSGPTSAWICHNATGNFNENKMAFAPLNSGNAVTGNQIIWNFADFITTSAIKFRIYAWGITSAGGGTSSTSGTMRIDKFSLSGAVTAIGSGSSGTPFTFDLPNGLVGLGKTPTQKLDIEGNTRISKLFVGSVDDTKVTTVSGSSENYTLSVTGTALFNKARVKLYTSWPDYVFNKNYKLLPLSKLEKFIKINKHLPGLISAGDAEKNGIDIANTQATFLQKIEELTLYIIEQNKKIEALQKRLETVEKTAIN